MRTRKVVVLFSVAMMALIFAAGCSNPVKKVMPMLGGTEEQQQEAMDKILIEIPDPMPGLKDALTDKENNVTARKNVAMMLGVVGEKNGDDSAVETLVAALPGSEPEVQDTIVKALEKIPGEKSRAALRDLLDSDVEAVAKLAWDILDVKAREKESQADSMVGEASYDRKIELLEEAYQINPRNQQIVNKLAAFYEVKGNDEKARELYNAGGSFVPAVKVIGPFPGNKSEEFIDAASFDTSASVSVNGETLEWFDFTDVPAHGIIDFRKSRKTKISKSIFYTAFKINSKAEEDVVLKLYTRSEVKLWINGELVFEADPKEARAKNEHEIPLKLKSGENTALLKLRSKKYARFSVRISDLKHKKTDAVSYGL